ncbi:MAG: DNA polymerase III subunit beta [Paludibacteraceae bacterium]|nr:DNA polymerase III subunit beta [Candidatus Physcocola equi]MCQ2233209.1 DNA polymerase III subunit beta [Paludibacteraceae bacterium]
MKFTVSSSDLLEHLQNIGSVISNKTNTPILDDFLFTLEDGQLWMTASDQEATMITSMMVADSEGNGSICVSALTLLQALREMSNQVVTFDMNTQNGAVSLLTETGHSDFGGESADQYIRLPEINTEESNTLSIAAQDLLYNIEKVSIATSTDDKRPILTALYFGITPEMVTTAATDSHKLIRLRNLNVKGDKDCSFMLPRKSASLLKKVLAKEEMDIEIQFDSKFIFFQTSNYKLICRQIEGKFPDYNKVIPTNNEIKLVINREDLISRIRRVSVFANKADNMVKMEMSNQSNTIIKAQDIDLSRESEEKISCSYDGPAMTLGFKSQYFLELLNNVNTEDIEITISDPTRPVLIYPYGISEEEAAKHELVQLIMPVMTM